MAKFGGGRCDPAPPVNVIELSGPAWRKVEESLAIIIGVRKVTTPAA
jgi:hypothetical protein